MAASTPARTPTPRRRFLLKGLGLGVAGFGALVLGWGVLPPRQRLRGSDPLPVQDGAVALNGWLALRPDGMVVLAMPRSEMGQGVHTALAMLVAEELDVPLASITLMQAPIDKIFGNVAMLVDGLPFHPDDDGRLKRLAQWTVAKAARELGVVVTGGSSSVKDGWQPMREAGASARAMLVAAACAQWQASAAQCRTQDGEVLHADGRRASYASLVQSASALDPGQPVLKSPAHFKLIGKAMARTDTQAKVNGRAVFGIDARPPGMLYAALHLPRRLGDTLSSFDAPVALAMPGVKKVLDLTSALGAHSISCAAVVADTWWRARQAAATLPTQWQAGAQSNLSSAEVFADFARLLDVEAGHVYHASGEVEGKHVRELQQITAEYHAPFLAHAAMEPVNCTAQVKDGKVHLWVSTQAPGIAVDVAARVAGVASGDVTIEVLLLGGGFGRRLEVDMVAQAVAIALQCEGAPVQLIWTREQDTQHDMYRPAALARFHARQDAHGRIASWDNKSVSASITHQYLQRNFGLPGMGPDKTTAEGEFDLPYEIAHQRIAHVIADSLVPVGYWRSVGHSHNAFFKESFIDELAHAAAQDGVAFRRAMLQHHPRHLAVLDAAVAQAGSAPPGHAHGVALHQSFGSIVAQVAQVSVENGEIRVHRVVCAIDCGLAVNPNIVAQQMESSVLFGLSAALGGEITFKEGKVVQGNFHDYPVLRMGQAPHVETIIIASAAHPQGVGEPGTPPIAPAVANAVFTLTGRRLRSLPLRLG
ncbi:xanthine dehydrogenase family protein molybdopterin-binding subunit [Janthinobacterium sp. PC23-8]|uniref:xanthine dehydrogenase family protein molybdopterin-binding subunit n=1 Tax=Janthinobacterium sp. PC23-8 TaxID=2012679 RepID=UPI000B9715C8|nr:xanthine dehydrogenase family protein molybdopterin-binding subunit [Janthinobacterium sp. PC23-8]OYO29962.1 acylaldehyde oxidase [Janthinobacterium sp. PC23-8]